jgi:hypothetical protein
MGQKKIIVAAILLVLLVVGLFLLQGKKAETLASELVFYGRVCLGPDKTNGDLTLHFIVQGERIFLDRNKDDVAQPDERLVSDELEPIANPATGVTYRITEIRLTKGLAMVSAELPQNLGLTVIVTGNQSYEQLGRVVLSIDPQNPGWAHIDGNNRLIFGDAEIELMAGEVFQLAFYFGTNAIGRGADVGTERILNSDQNIDLFQLTESDQFSPVVPQEGGPYPEMTIKIPTSGEPFLERIPLNEFC